MRHAKAFKKLNRTAAHRRSLLRNMTSSLVLHEHCETTIAKAKAIKPVIEKLITLGRKDTLHSRRKAYSWMTDKDAVQKLFSVLGPRYMARPGGYTRIVRTGRRHGDAAELAIIELIKSDSDVSVSAGAASSKKAAGAKSTRKPAKDAAEKAPAVKTKARSTASASSKGNTRARAARKSEG